MEGFRLQAASHVRAPRAQYGLPARTVILRCIRVFEPANSRDQVLGLFTSTSGPDLEGTIDGYRLEFKMVELTNNQRTEIHMYIQDNGSGKTLRIQNNSKRYHTCT